MLPDDEIHIWPVPLTETRAGDSARDAVAAVWEELAPDERARALRTGDPRARARYVAARSRLRRTLASYLGVEPGAVRLRGGRHGKPELAGGGGPRFNLSHSGDVALLAVSATRDVGVDVERVRPVMDVVRLARRFFTPDEYALVSGAEQPPDTFARLWTRKEACVKALGGTLFQGLAAPVAGEGGTRVVGKPDGHGGGALRVTDLRAPEGFAAAVAVDGAAPFTVVWRDHSLSP